jgi:hypothetical protein
MTGSIITKKGRIIMLDRSYHDDGDATYTAPSQFTVGINGSDPTVATTALDNPVPITGTESVDACDATTGWTAGTDSAVSLNTTTYKEGTGALNIYKTGTSANALSASKTTTSRNFSSKDFHAWVYLTAVTDLISAGTALSIRFGSDASNYWQRDYDVSTLADGWNLVVFDTSSPSSQVGSPDGTSCDYTAVLLYTDLAADTIAAGRVIVDDLKLASDGDYLKSYETGYPLVDETNVEVETQMFLPSTMANGYDIDSVAMVNTDATVQVFSVDVFTSESKSSTDEFIMISKDRLL